MIKRIFILFIFLVTSCGYQPIYINNNLENLIFYKITLKGDNNINRKIINTVSFKENSLNDELNELAISSSFNIFETSKNSPLKQPKPFSDKFFLYLFDLRNLFS